MKSSSRLIFRAQHNPTTPIVVTYRADPADNSSGCDITVDGELWARVFNPADVTRWFLRTSRANLEAWRAAYHCSGLSGADFARPRPFDAVLEVPYYSQRDNQRYPGGTCNVTSYAMALAYFKAPRRDEKKWPQREDELSAFLEAQKNPKRDRHNHEDLAWMGRQYGLDARFGMSRTWDEIRAQIRAGNPVVVSGTFTSAGHIIALIGLKGNDFIVNDPFGNALERYRARNGAGLVYPFAYMEATVKGGANSKWAHFIHRKA